MESDRDGDGHHATLTRTDCINYLPEYLEVLEALPHTPSGKIQKFKRREQAKCVRLDGSKRG